MDSILSGFREISHTADWALEVWAPDLAELLVQAALGMFSLMEIQVEPGTQVISEFSVAAEDAESLLVAFLTELLYQSEIRHAGFTQLDLRVTPWVAHLKASGGHLAAQRKEIKAVTYHRLKIQKEGNGLRVVIVFDV